jgi:hypothetical protein
MTSTKPSGQSHQLLFGSINRKSSGQTYLHTDSERLKLSQACQCWQVLVGQGRPKRRQQQLPQARQALQAIQQSLCSMQRQYYVDVRHSKPGCMLEGTMVLQMAAAFCSTSQQTSPAALTTAQAPQELRQACIHLLHLRKRQQQPRATCFPRHPKDSLTCSTDHCKCA